MTPDDGGSGQGGPGRPIDLSDHRRPRPGTAVGRQPALGSLQRRLRHCMIGMRAEPYPYGAQEYVNMELYLMGRARGMKLETPAVRP